ncbi:hypothetical protein LSH36_1141g00038 [Paralvinella palmiformis]|uniref:Eukaryotic translation initiation factor 3 subunit H n=1 Tax=Paralvinella palmiformis TaxID=53620 RepID=A0AAD9IUH0_9ANNE|nr:hypothetical protein LSH36_1141g00038 [Paralvinella palmiformis]
MGVIVKEFDLIISANGTGVVLKIIKHCHEEGAGGRELVQGVLLGLVDKNRLEVTNCFPFPRHTEDEDFDEVAYQMEMMRHLRHVNVDHLHVGWYQSTYFGQFITKALLDSQFNYQHSIEESIVLVYDPLRTSKGHLTLRAMRLTPAMMKMYNEGDFTPEKLKVSSISFDSMFEEVPVCIKNSHLINALCSELDEILPEDNQYNFLDLATSNTLECNLRHLMEGVDELSQDANKFYNYQRQCVKQVQLRLQKKEQENQVRKARGEPLITEEELNKLIKPPQAPSRLDSLLISGQINSFSDQIKQFSSQSFGKLFMAESLQDHSCKE